jgi:hypothetical protein
MRYKNYRISVLKTWLCDKPKGRERITKMYLKLTKAELKKQQTYSFELDELDE